MLLTVPDPCRRAARPDLSPVVAREVHGYRRRPRLTEPVTERATPSEEHTALMTPAPTSSPPAPTARKVGEASCEQLAPPQRKHEPEGGCFSVAGNWFSFQLPWSLRPSNASR